MMKVIFILATLTLFLGCIEEQQFDDMEKVIEMQTSGAISIETIEKRSVSDNGILEDFYTYDILYSTSDGNFGQAIIIRETGERNYYVVEITNTTKLINYNKIGQLQKVG